jgi:hypothetical protein
VDHSSVIIIQLHVNVGFFFCIEAYSYGSIFLTLVKQHYAVAQVTSVLFCVVFILFKRGDISPSVSVSAKHCSLVVVSPISHSGGPGYVQDHTVAHVLCD